MKIQKKLASKVLNVSPKRVKFDQQRLEDIKSAITKSDIRQLVEEKAIKGQIEKGVSRGRARKLKTQKSKGQRKGKGSRQGKSTARLPRKESWMNKIRSQRKLLLELKEKSLISNESYRQLYLKAKGGFFRSTRHIKIYLEDNKLFLEKENKETETKKESKTTKKTTKKATKKASKSKSDK